MLPWRKGFIVIVSLVFAYLLTPADAGVPRSSYEALMKQESVQETGLYNHTDKVKILNQGNFKAEVPNRNRSILVEFYNSYCGHCRKFAPTYKKLSEELYEWRDIIPISAIDCADEENNGICREYEVMAYPTLRYFGPFYTPSANSYGHHIKTQNLDEIRVLLAEYVAAENKTANMSTWPDFKPLQSIETESLTSLFSGLDNSKKFVVIVYEPENSTVGVETILNFQRYSNIAVKRTSNPDLAAKYSIDGSRYRIATVGRHGSVVPYSSLHETSKSFKETIESFLKSQHLTEKPPTKEDRAQTTQEVSDDNSQIDTIIEEVKRNKHMVYQADLEMAIRDTLHNEIPKTSNISGEKLLALQQYLKVLSNYNPLSSAGNQLIKQLSDFTLRHHVELSGDDFENEVKRLEADLGPIYSSSHFVGCVGSRTGLRGFTCSLWQLFHFMTVQAARMDRSEDPLEVLQAMHGYVKYFFGCTECSKHFQEMAKRRKIWNNPSKDEAILWLWAAHNEVNQRLSGDETDDPKFPKTQFPTAASCPQCIRQQHHDQNSDNAWHKDKVLQFLKNIHNPEYVSRYGIDDAEVLQPTLEKLRQKRMISSVFTDMDMGMGMLLYGFCIVMLVVAFKLFAFKGGYRKKPYGHDMLGKV